MSFSSRAPSTPSILVVEDDPDLADLLCIHLSDLGYQVDHASDGRQGLALALENTYALLILDVMLPGIDGFEVCKRVRAEDRYLPILMLTAKTEEMDKVLGLELGADDYLTKPFSVRELLARIKAIQRRIEIDHAQYQKEEEEPLLFGDLIVYPQKRKVTLRGEAIELTAKEFTLLLLFAQNPGRAYNRQELLDQVWGYQYSGYSHTVNSHINRLRSKIEEDPSSPRFIQTVWGVGYRFIEQAEVRL